MPFSKGLRQKMSNGFLPMKTPGSKTYGDSRNNSLDTTSSMNTAETETTCHTGGESDFADCPFLGHRLYTPISEVFEQSLGMVYLARQADTGSIVAIKLVERGASVTRHVASELLIHRRCTGHPFIVQLLDVFLMPRHLAIVLEHVPSGDTLEMVNERGGLPEEEARWLFQQLLVSMMYLHSLGADNRELKLENMLLSFSHAHEDACDTATTTTTATAAAAAAVNGIVVLPETVPTTATVLLTDGSSISHPVSTHPTVKLQDFMYSKSEQINSDPHSALGSLPYTAPEVLSNSMKEGTAADAWALGVALFKLATGMFPFEREEDGRDARRTVQVVLSRIARVEYAIPEHLSPELRDLLGRMLVRAPTERMRMEDILAHPWVQRDMPAEVIHANEKVDPEKSPLSEAVLQQVIDEAQISLRPLNSDNVEDMADELLNEEEADDLLEELCLG